MNKKSRIFIAGHNGMVGSAFYRYFRKKNYKNIFIIEKSKLDLTNKTRVNLFFKKKKFDIVILAAAKVGGIYANNIFPVQFIEDNLNIQNNIISASYMFKVKKLLFIGSSCIYPNNKFNKISEKDMLSSYLEKTNEPYAIAKIAGIKTCESYNRQFKTDYRTVIPCNLYGPNDNFHPNNSHVLGALMKKFHDAKVKKFNKIVLWGSGKPKREFMHVDDMVEASVKVLKISKKIYDKLTKPQQSFINVGSGTDVSIMDLAKIIQKVIGLSTCKFIFDKSKPDGTKKKLLDISIIKNKLKFKPKFNLHTGIKDSYISNNFKI